MFEIYEATCLVSGKRYIGMTISTIKKRWATHIEHAKRKPTGHFHAAIRKYGADNFVIRHFASATNLAYLKELEQIIIRQENTQDRTIGYNVTKGGDGGPPWGRKAIENSAAKRRGSKLSKQTLERMSVGISAAKKGKAPPRCVADAARKANTGRKHPPEFALAIVARLKGVPKSESHKEAIRQANLGKKASEATREKIRITSTGRLKTPEECERIRLMRLNDSLETKAMRYAKKWVPKYAPFYVNPAPTVIPQSVLDIAAQYA